MQSRKLASLSLSLSLQIFYKFLFKITTSHEEFSFPSFFKQIPNSKSNSLVSSESCYFADYKYQSWKYPILPDPVLHSLQPPPSYNLKGKMLEVQFPVLIQLKCLLLW